MFPGVEATVNYSDSFFSFNFQHLCHSLDIKRKCGYLGALLFNCLFPEWCITCIQPSYGFAVQTPRLAAVRSMLPAQYFLLPHPSKHSLVYQLVFLAFSPPRVIQVALLEVKIVCTKRHQIFLLFSPDNILPFGLPTFLGFLIGTSRFCPAPSWGDIWCHSFSVTWWTIK